jgi:Mg-chelatase subunit ChlD
VADIDGDGSVEIIAGMTPDRVTPDRPSEVVAFNADGSRVVGWPGLFVPRIVFSSPVISDIDLDGDLEVIIGGTGVFVWDLPAATAGALEWATARHDNRRTGTYQAPGQVVLLYDTSASMGDSPEGGPAATPAEQKIALAREATYPFLELLGDFATSRVQFGIAAFPGPTLPFECGSDVLTPITPVTSATIANAIVTTVPSLMPAGFTPLLSGVETARRMLDPSSDSAIILLSDGAHNCPREASVGDPEVTALIDRLRGQPTRVFSIGFGSPADIDPPLLEELATQTTPADFTGSQFYDVTVPGFDPASWTPATALQATYKSILIDALNLDAIVDPLDSIEGGRAQSFDVSVSEPDRTVSFFLSWKTPQTGRLHMTIRASDRSTVPVTGPGIRFHQGATYAILTVGRELLGLPGKVTSRPWQFEVRADNLGPNESEMFQYSVIVDSALRMRPGFDHITHRVGDSIALTVDLREGARLMTTGIAHVEVLVIAPNSKKPDVVALFDNGTHGDVVANDGIYSGTFTGAGAAGSYSFRFHADAKTSRGNTFTRERVMQLRVR